MPGPTDAALRDAIFDLLQECRAGTPSNEEIAERAGVPVEEVHARFESRSSQVLNFMLHPFVDTVDDALRSLPMSATPTTADQRQTLSKIVDAAMTDRPQMVTLLGILVDWFKDPGPTLVDQFTYQAGVRLLGTTYEPHSDEMIRVRFVVQLIAMACVSRWHDLHEERERTALIDSVLGILNPPT